MKRKIVKSVLLKLKKNDFKKFQSIQYLCCKFINYATNHNSGNRIFLRRYRCILVNDKVLANVVAGQKIHEQYGGVVPELASRAHQSNIIPVVDAAIKQLIAV